MPSKNNDPELNIHTEELTASVQARKTEGLKKHDTTLANRKSKALGDGVH